MNNGVCRFLPVQVAIEWLESVPENERTRERLAKLLDHFLGVYGVTDAAVRLQYLNDAAPVAQARYRIPDEVFSQGGGA